METWGVNPASKDSRKKKKGGFSGGAEWMRDEECYSDVEEEAKEGREKLRQMKRCCLHGSRSHLCVCGGGSAGSRRPLSCVWSRSLAGGHVGGG